MAKMQYNPETHKVEDKSPGRSIYLSNLQWAALNEYLEIITNQGVSMEAIPEVADAESLCATLMKLYKISEEVCNK